MEVDPSAAVGEDEPVAVEVDVEEQGGAEDEGQEAGGSEGEQEGAEAEETAEGAEAAPAAAEGSAQRGRGRGRGRGRSRRGRGGGRGGRGGRGGSKGPTPKKQQQQQQKHQQPKQQQQQKQQKAGGPGAAGGALTMDEVRRGTGHVHRWLAHGKGLWLLSCLSAHASLWPSLSCRQRRGPGSTNLAGAPEPLNCGSRLASPRAMSNMRTLTPPSPSPVLAQISKDRLTQLAQENWSPAALQSDSPPAFSSALVEEIYNTELGGNSNKPPSSRRLGRWGWGGWLVRKQLIL